MPTTTHALTILAATLLACSGGDAQTSATTSSTSSTTVTATDGESSTSAASATTKGTTANVSDTAATDPTTTGTTTSTTGTTTSTTGEIKDCFPPDVPCPEGMKCTFDGDVSYTHCVPLDPAPKGHGDPCNHEGDPFSGIDDCGDGLLCWNVDARTGVGVCVGFCQSNGDPFCPLDPAATCAWCQACALGICVPSCDPLLGGECPNGHVCVPTNESFTCVIQAGEGAQGAPCEYVNTCAEGLFCADAALLPACDGSGCCTAFCDLQAPQCPDGLTCTPWYEQDPPPGLQDVGACILPP